MDFPSFLLRALGVFLVLLGLTGMAAGIYGLSLVGGYEGELASASGAIKESLNASSFSLKDMGIEVEASIGDTSSGMGEASLGIEKAGEEIDSASKGLKGASEKLTATAGDLTLASNLNEEAGRYLGDAALGLGTWADNYEFNGSPLPGKDSFKDALENMSTASSKLSESGDKMSAAAGGIEATASNLGETSTKLEKTSEELGGVGSYLGDASTDIGKLNEPLGKLISEIAVPLEDSVSGVDTAKKTIPRVLSVLRVGLVYFIFMHLTLVGMGLALIVIEVNLFYPT